MNFNLLGRVKMLKPIDIAKKLNISTSALRHYESWGIIPTVPRSSNGYREYTEEHVAYFQCIRAMLPGFSKRNHDKSPVKRYHVSYINY